MVCVVGRDHMGPRGAEPCKKSRRMRSRLAPYMDRDGWRPGRPVDPGPSRARRDPSGAAMIKERRSTPRDCGRICASLTWLGTAPVASTGLTMNLVRGRLRRIQTLLSFDVAARTRSLIKRGPSYVNLHSPTLATLKRPASR